MKSLAATLLFLTGAALAEDDLAALVRDLGSENYDTRDAATVRLTEIGEPARALLEAARSSVDAEVRLRAGRVLAVLDVRRRVDQEYEVAREAFDSATREDAARLAWLEVLRLVARGEDDRLAPQFASGAAPARFWESARYCPLAAIVDLSWVEVVPSRRLGWLGLDVGPNDVLVMGAVPEEVPDPESVPETYVREPRALLLRPVGEDWRVRLAPPSGRLVHPAYDELARTESQKREWAAGALTVETLASGHNGIMSYGLAQALDAVGDFQGALRAFARCQPTGQWPDYCIVHRYFDLMRLGRRGDAARVLQEEPGGGSCEYLLNVIRWLRGEMTAEDLQKYAEGQGAYETESFYYYLGLERLIAGDVDRAKEHLTRCAEQGGGCYEQDFAADALWLLERGQEEQIPSGEGH
ncbi:MAG: hypothetical protein AAB434_05645 [Planctomycetota bacterium]